MKALHNIEKSAFRHGEYVGYSDGPWRIVKINKVWRCIHAQGKHWSIEAKTLEELSKQLAERVAV